MKKLRLLMMTLCVTVLMGSMAVTAYAGGGEEWSGLEPVEPPPAETVDPGEGFTEDGNLVTRDLLYDKATNKQFITVQSKSGNTFYIVIDRSGDTENVYFLNLVDEADLMALMGDDAEQADTTCICQTHCEVGAINTDCPVCKVSMPDCMGKTQTVQKDPEPVVDTKPEAVTDTRSDSAQKKSNAPLILLLLVLLGGGFALYWFKLRKPKPDTKGSADLDDYDFGEEDDADELEETVDEDEPV